MITVYYERYCNDYLRRSEKKCFSGLEELADWIFNQMETNYSDKDKGFVYMFFPQGKPSTIEFKPKIGGNDIWIHKIEEDNNIIFSDGKMTAQQKHWSNRVKEWCKSCRERQYSPKFKFAE